MRRQPSVYKHILGALCGALLLMGTIHSAHSDIKDPLDPFDIRDPDSTSPDENDDTKSAAELLLDATQLFADSRPLDARTKLLKALAKDPKRYQTHMMLAGYYIEHVGHYRLALRYAKQAEDLIIAQNGPPPYEDSIANGEYKAVASEHKQILYLLAQARLNLDDYQGALATLDQFTAYGYFEPWYPDLRAWILMKLGRLDEAIKESRLGILSGVDGGRALNMLGILLSMHDERAQSLVVLKKAIEYELSLGKEGEPATPLNNAGEVYNELFEEDRAESSWLKATSLPDGCEHVLPSLNLTLLYIAQLNFKGAKQAMDNFEACVAQYPLRNGEEHRAFVAFARGRIAMHTGSIDTALTDLETAVEQQQWFGKIGTEPKELQAGALISLSQALTMKQNQMSFHSFKSLAEHASWLKQKAVNYVRAWWLMRRARQIVAEDLNDAVDIEVRHSDSMMEYPTMGDALSGFPESQLRAKVTAQGNADVRIYAKPYYELYLAENLLAHGDKDEARTLLEDAITKGRPRIDAAMIEHAKMLLLKNFFVPGEEEYSQLANQVYAAKHAELRNYGLRLPVSVINEDPNNTMVSRLRASAFYIDSTAPQNYIVRLQAKGSEQTLSFESKNNQTPAIKVSGSDLDDVINKFTDEVFSEELGDETKAESTN